jgi:nitroreductase
MKKLLFGLAISAIALTSCSQNKQTQDEKKNETLESILNRRSVRAYTQEPVSDEAINIIIKAAINAPSARNAQPWQVRVVKNQRLINAIQDGVAEKLKTQNPDFASRRILFDAPVVIVVANDTTSPYGQLDCGWLGQNILLTAHSLGLGTCVVAMANDFLWSEQAKEVIGKLNFPDDYKVIYCIALGHQKDETPDAKPRDIGKVQIID